MSTEQSAEALSSAERAVLSAIILDPHAFREANRILDAEDFFEPRHRKIFRAMADLADNGQKIDLITLMATFEERRELHEIGGKLYLTELYDGYSRSTNVAAYAGIVRTGAQKRRIWSVAHRVQKESRSPDGSRLQRVIEDLRRHADHLASSDTVLEPALAEREMPDRLFSWSSLPETTALLFSGEVLVLAGAAGRGKSTLALQLMLAAAITKLHDRKEGRICGLRIASGDSVIVSFEDTLAVAEHRLRAIADAMGGKAPAAARRIRFAGSGANEEALFGVPPGASGWSAAGPADRWAALWSSIALASPPVRYVVLDPAGSAFAGNPNEVSGVRAFLLALRREARAHNLGVILVAHPNKTGSSQRNRKPGGRPVTDAVSGSSAWTDAARAVLTLDEETDAEGEKTWTLVGDKANYSPPSSIELKRVAVPGSGIGAGIFRSAVPI